MLERVFKLSENKTNVRTEVVAGITTFLTMAYIIFVNPDILKAAGMPFGAVFTATCVAAAIGCFLMAFLANYPIALAPGMGLNAYFAFGVVGGMKSSLAGGAGLRVHLGHHLLHHQRAADPRMDRQRHSQVAQDGDRRRHRPVPGADRAQERRRRRRRPGDPGDAWRAHQLPRGAWRRWASS